MSKIVIVFSTYFNSPVAEDYLFSKDTTTSRRFCSEKLCDYFWKQVLVDLNKIAEHRSDYLSREALIDLNERITKIKDDREKELKKYLSDNEDVLVGFLETNADEIKTNNSGQQLAFSIDDFDWITKLSMLIDYKKIEEDPNGVVSGLIEMNNESNKDETITCVDLLKKDYNGVWLSKSLKDSGSQTPLDTVLSEGVSFGDQPWLHYRFSYYKFNKIEGDPNDVSVYAVWPLKNVSPDDNGKKVWIEALTEQFLSLRENDDADTLYLILHDKDIEKETPFTIYSIDEVNKSSEPIKKVYRCVVLFQHADNIGKFLGTKKLEMDNKNKSLEDIKQFVLKEVSVDHYATMIAKKVNIDAIDDPSVEVQEDVQKIIDKELLDEIAKLDEKLREAID